MSYPVRPATHVYGGRHSAHECRVCGETVRWRRRTTSRTASRPSAGSSRLRPFRRRPVLEDDATVLKNLPPGPIGAIITSPPYAATYDYLLHTMPYAYGGSAWTPARWPTGRSVRVPRTPGSSRRTPICLGEGVREVLPRRAACAFAGWADGADDGRFRGRRCCESKFGRGGRGGRSGVRAAADGAGVTGSPALPRPNRESLPRSLPFAANTRYSCERHTATGTPTGGWKKCGWKLSHTSGSDRFTWVCRERSPQPLVAKDSCFQVDYPRDTAGRWSRSCRLSKRGWAIYAGIDLLDTPAGRGDCGDRPTGKRSTQRIYCP